MKPIGRKRLTGWRLHVPFDLYDIAVLVGLLALGQGLWWVAPSLALIVVGVLVLLFGLFGALLKAAAARRGER